MSYIGQPERATQNRCHRAGALGIIEKDAAGKVFVPWDEIDVNMPLARAA